jgi:predicted O-linked N-acetylglucosamine transferase (SPINDLY family)
MDYFIGDQYVPCPGTENLFTEQIYRMPRVHSCYRPPADPGIVPPPFFKNGYITFGSFNDPRKITRSFLKVWSVLMHLFPDSKILMKYANLDRPMGQKRWRQWFMEDGIAADRLQFEPFSSTAFDYFKSWNNVDIALDPFPYNGGTTTMDALWMGVPVVSMGGRLTVSTTSASLLTEVGLPVAATAEQYIALAAQMVSAIRERPQIRQQLRDTMLTSRLMDEKGLTRTLGTAYREMWRTWCNSQVRHSGSMKGLGEDA